MTHRKHNVAIGLSSLLVSIPTPTFIHKHFETLISQNYINIFQTEIAGFEAQMLLIMLITASIGLFAIALYELGGYLTAIGSNQNISRLTD